MSKSAVKIAVLGAGLIGLRHCALVKASPQAELAAIVDPYADPVKLSSEFGVPVYEDLSDIPAGVCDAAIIATPNASHVPLGIMCAALGLPALIEKPVSDDLESGEQLVAEFERLGLPLLVGHHRRYHAFVDQTIELLGSGQIGDPVCASIQWTLRKNDEYYDQGAWRLGKDGGPIMINLIHEVDMIRAIFGDIVEIQAMTSSKTRGLPVEDTGAVILRFASGVMATVLFSDTALTPWSFESSCGENPQIAEMGVSPWRIGCTKGALEFPTMQVWQTEGKGAGSWGDKLVSSNQAGPKTVPLEAQLDHFIALVRGEIATPKVSGREGLESLRATLAIRDAAGL